MTLPDLTRTIKAIEAYDKAADASDLEALEALGESVGEAFGLDTSDRNNLNDCKQLIRPGPKVPGSGYELSFVRRMVELWRKEHKGGTK